MLVAPIQVFTSIHGTHHSHNDATHRLLIVKTKEEAQPHLIIQDSNNIHAGFTRLMYSDCHFDTQGEFHYTERLEQLIYDFTQGYNSAGVSINAGYAQTRLDMVDTVLNRLKNFIARQNIRGDGATTRKIKAEYGFIGFSDHYCYDYGNKQQIKNTTAAQMDINNILQPLELTMINYTLDSIKSVSRQYPTLLICRLTNANNCQSDFAWIDIPSLSSLPNPHDCTNSYLELETLIKSYSNPEFYGRLDSKYSMAHVLSQYFGGSYQTMVFTHFTEYGKYDADHDLGILEYTSGLRNIKCVVAQSRPNPFLLEQSRNQELRDELGKNKSTVEDLKISNADLQQEIVQLKDQAASHDAQTSRLTLTRNFARAAMNRQRISSEIEIASVKQGMNQLRILLVEANVSCQSYEYAMTDLEHQVRNEKKMNDQHQQLQKENESDVKNLKKKINALEGKIKSLEHDSNLHNLQNEKLKSDEGVYMNQLGDMDMQIEQLTKQIDSLSRERDSIRLETEKKMQKMEKTHQIELNVWQDKLRQQLDQADIDKGRMMTLMHNNDRTQARTAKKSVSFEEQYRSQQNSQQSPQHSISTQFMQKSVIGNPPAPTSNTTRDDQGIRQREYLPQTSYLHLSDDEHDMVETSIRDKTTMAPITPSSLLKHYQPAMVRPLHTKEPTPPTPLSEMKKSKPKSARQPLKSIHSPPALSASQSPPLSPILPSMPLEKPASLDIENAPKTKTTSITSLTNHQTDNSTMERISRTTDLFQHFGLSDSEDDGDDGVLSVLSGRGKGRQPITETAELKQDNDFFAPPRNIVSLKPHSEHEKRKPKIAKEPRANKEKPSPSPMPQNDNKAATQKPQPAATQKSSQSATTQKSQPATTQKSQPATTQKSQPAAPKSATKKRRKLRGTRMDETNMSPVLHGYAAKYFENT